MKTVHIGQVLLFATPCISWQERLAPTDRLPPRHSFPRDDLDENKCKSVGTGDDLDETTIPSKAPQSRLARLAEDWMEEEEEDQLLDYWARFDEKTPICLDDTQQDSTIDEDDRNLTTEERLQRYLDSRGIRRKEELEHQEEIQAALYAAQKATSAKDALQVLEEVQDWLQVHTRLGGLVLVEFLIATWQHSGDLDEDLCRALLKNPHDIVVSKVKQLLRAEKPPQRNPSFWGGLFSPSSGQWWWE